MDRRDFVDSISLKIVKLNYENRTDAYLAPDNLGISSVIDSIALVVHTEEQSNHDHGED